MACALKNGYNIDYYTMYEYVLDFVKEYERYPLDSDINQPWSMIVDRIEENDMPDVWKEISLDTV